MVLTNFNKTDGLRGIGIDDDHNGFLQLRKGTLKLLLEFSIGSLVGDHIRQFRIIPKMVERIDQHPRRYKDGEKEDKGRMGADEIGPLFKKTC